MITFDGLFARYAAVYRSKSYRDFDETVAWDASVAEFMESVSARRCASRRTNYVIPGELERGGESIRFGTSKPGHGYHGTRGDFCMVGGVLIKSRLTLFYRSLELLGGLHYDAAVIAHIERVRGPIRSVRFMALRAAVFALAGNSNEKLHAKLTEFYDGRQQST